MLNFKTMEERFVSSGGTKLQATLSNTFATGGLLGRKTEQLEIIPQETDKNNVEYT